MRRLNARDVVVMRIMRPERRGGATKADERRYRDEDVADA
jgi:hypothetical protein